MAHALLPDELWSLIETHLPAYRPSPKGGRPRIGNRAALIGILFVLKTGIPWGGDYGFAWMPHGTNANDQYFVDYIGMTPTEALLSAPRLGGQIMLRPDELGQVRPGFLADLVLVDGDPLQDLRILTQAAKIAMVMQDGVIHKGLQERNPSFPRRRERRVLELASPCNT